MIFDVKSIKVTTCKSIRMFKNKDVNFLNKYLLSVIMLWLKIIIRVKNDNILKLKRYNKNDII